MGWGVGVIFDEVYVDGGAVVFWVEPDTSAIHIEFEGVVLGVERAAVFDGVFVFGEFVFERLNVGFGWVHCVLGIGLGVLKRYGRGIFLGVVGLGVCMVTAREFDEAARRGLVSGHEGVDSGETPDFSLGAWETVLCPHSVGAYSVFDRKVVGPEDDDLYFHECGECGRVVVTWD